ncbi:MAG: hypothetical protein AB1631_14210 [Acidobacteriota bacterium]
MVESTFGTIVGASLLPLQSVDAANSCLVKVKVSVGEATNWPFNLAVTVPGANERVGFAEEADEEGRRGRRASNIKAKSAPTLLNIAGNDLLVFVVFDISQPETSFSESWTWNFTGKPPFNLLIFSISVSESYEYTSDYRAACSMGEMLWVNDWRDKCFG